LTTLEIESGSDVGRYWVGIARYTNRGWGKDNDRYTLSPDFEKFKNAGGVPSTREEHLDPTIIGAKEGVEEIAFCRNQGPDTGVLFPSNLGQREKCALKESIERLNDAVSRTGNDSSLRQLDEKKRTFVPAESPLYVCATFAPTGYRLKIFQDDTLINECVDVVLSWTPRYSALEVTKFLFQLRIPNGADLDGILTADGPDDSRLRFAEDVYVADINQLRRAAVGGGVKVRRLNTTEFPTWRPTADCEGVPYTPADALQDLLDALIGWYDFTRSL
jgi:hypothetical protein